ncbi:aldo/keto reductase [Hahella sp. CCB-MM4]|uniref:aldo/keto reductase n=1 Tax=Hahella sp. (strain CCB-MM4) TaxID=1926491 RepID=UPI001FEDA015|nr:aldo/keto reductase [Hahella sp. CCB-MM4]
MSVSCLGLGTVKLGRNQGVKYPQGFEIPNDMDAKAIIDLAADLGMNLIDTAPAYGTSEERLGTLLKGQRDRWIICSKVGEEFEQGQSSFDFSPEHVRYSVERSLKRLNTDYIDMVLVHSDGNDLDIIRKGTLEALDDLRQQGKIRATGMSTKTVEGGIASLQHSDIVMVTYNINEQDEGAVIDYARDHGKGVLVKKALASGHLCLKPGEDPLTESFRFVFSHPGVTSAIVGTINPLHMKANVDALNRVMAQ